VKQTNIISKCILIFFFSFKTTPSFRFPSLPSQNYTQQQYHCNRYYLLFVICYLLLCCTTHTQSYTDTMHKIAKVSKILAMALPHSLFLCLGVGLKIAFPGAIRWVTYETPTTVILTMYYPFVSTLVWIHTQRHNWGNSNNISEGDGNTATTTTNNDNNDTATNKRSSKQKQSGKVGTKTKSGISNLKNKFNTTATTMKGGDDKEKSFSTGFVTETIALATTKYWLNYWQLYAIIQAFGSYPGFLLALYS
jgi:hypothetical protein